MRSEVGSNWVIWVWLLKLGGVGSLVREFFELYTQPSLHDYFIFSFVYK